MTDNIIQKLDNTLFNLSKEVTLILEKVNTLDNTILDISKEINKIKEYVSKTTLKTSQQDVVLKESHLRLSIAQRDVAGICLTEGDKSVLKETKICHSCPSRYPPFRTCSECNADTCESCLISGYDGLMYCYMCYNVFL